MNCKKLVKNKRYIEKVVIDVKIVKTIKRYRYYPYEYGKYYIPKYHNQYVQYGNNIKAIVSNLMNNSPNSTNVVITFISDITNIGITLSKWTLINWNQELANKLTNEKKESFSDEEYNNIIAEYDDILNELEIELREDTDNYLFDNELKLFTRLKYDNKNMDKKIRGDRDEVLYFIKEFHVPSTNNNAESSQRGVKIKQKIRKFRSVEGSDNYLKIKSYILTYKKQDKDILMALFNDFEGKKVNSL